jgi:hypothetical protein
MILSPHLLARQAYDALRIGTGLPPTLRQVGQLLLDTYNLAIPPQYLEKWMEEFKFNS